MSLRPQQCLILVCDGCGTEYEQDYVVHVDPDRDDLVREMARDDDWHNLADHDWCETCRLRKPHEFVATGTSECGLCGYEHDEEAS